MEALDAGLRTVFAHLDAALFYFFAVLAIVSALVVVGQRNPTYSAFALIVTIGCLSGVFGLLGSPFIAVLQLIVYAGAIMVLFLFVLMLLSVKAEEHPDHEGRAIKGAGFALGLLLFGQIATVLLRSSPQPVAHYEATTEKVARVLFATQFVYVFEATSILILAALVGAIVLAKKEL